MGNANVALTCLTLFTIFSTSLMTFVEAVSGLRGAMGCIERIENFLLTRKRAVAPAVGSLSSLSPSSQPSSSFSSSTSATGCPLQLSEMAGDMYCANHVSVWWNRADLPVLTDVNLRVPSGGTLTFIVGPVASGKSTLLKLLLGQVDKYEGFLWRMTDSVAYCDQTSWLVSESIRNSILGGQPFRGEWYHAVVKACLLDADINRMGQGDLTLIGGRGVTLSGGQRQRVVWSQGKFCFRELR